MGIQWNKETKKELKEHTAYLLKTLSKNLSKSHRKREVLNEMIVKASMDTGAFYRVKKCPEIGFRKGLTVLKEKMDGLEPNKNEIYKFLGCDRADKIDVKRVMERVKKEIRKRLDHLMRLHLNDKN